MNDHKGHESNSRARCNPALVGVHAAHVAQAWSVKQPDDAQGAN